MEQIGELAEKLGRAHSAYMLALQDCWTAQARVIGLAEQYDKAQAERNTTAQAVISLEAEYESLRQHFRELAGLPPPIPTSVPTRPKDDYYTMAQAASVRS